MPVLRLLCVGYIPRQCTAFLTPSNQVVVVVMNTGDSDIAFKLVDIKDAGKQAVKVIALAHSIQTFVYL